MKIPKMKSPIPFAAICLVLLSGGCYYDVEEELYPDTGCATDGITYSGFIQPLLEDNCYVCHNAVSQEGGIVLEGYDHVLVRVTGGDLIGALKHESGFSPMPQNQPKLVDCQIEKIEAWIAEGALNN
jgi:hypothetical protein